jgi:hypothetical protein
MILRQLSAKPSEDPQAPFSVCATTRTTTNARPERGARRPLQPFRVCSGSGLRTSHLRFRNPT